MKKTPFTQRISTTFILLTVCLTTTFAQQRFSIGPRIGLNYSTLTGGIAQPVNGSASVKYRPGLVAGAFLMYSSLNHFGISADVLYAQRGASFSLSQNGATIQYDQRINYLEIPVALRYFLTRSGEFRPNLFFGPSLGIRLNAQTTNGTVNGIENQTYNRDVSDVTSSLDLGVLAGFQLNFPGFFGERQRFLIDGRYTYGLTSMSSLPGVDGHNSVFTLTLGYGFGVGPEFRSRYRR